MKNLKKVGDREDITILLLSMSLRPPYADFDGGLF